MILNSATQEVMTMPDLRIIRPRACVRLHLYPGEICEMICDLQVMESFTVEELKKIKDCTKLELNRREQCK